MQFRLLVDLLLDALTGKALTRWVVSPRASEPCAEWFLLLRPISSVPVNLRFWSDFLSCGIPFAGSIEKEAIWPAEVIPAWFKSKTTTAHRKCYFPKVNWKARSSIFRRRIRTWSSEDPHYPGALSSYLEGWFRHLPCRIPSQSLVVFP